MFRCGFPHFTLIPSLLLHLRHVQYCAWGKKWERERERDRAYVCANYCCFTMFLRLSAFSIFRKSHNLCTKAGKNLYSTNNCIIYEWIVWNADSLKSCASKMIQCPSFFIHHTIKNTPFLLTFKHSSRLWYFFVVVLFCLLFLNYISSFSLHAKCYRIEIQ